MGLFSKEEIVFEKKDFRLGEFDPTNSTGTCYFNVMNFSFDVKKNRVLRIKVVSELPIDVAVAYEDGSMAGHKEQVTDSVIGPFNTNNFTNMGMFIAIYPGDKSTVSLKAWTDSR